jgi:hypothetical protein
MVSRVNETLRNAVPYPLSIQVGSGTAGTALTFDYAFSDTPSVSVSSASTSDGRIGLTSVSSTGITASTATGTPTFYYVAVGLRE